ncbi:MAG: hypothetical protein ABFD84_11020 [Candidatus Polarisedimenticolia bacterium]|nr:hypothetical protein [bacterium]
MTIRESTCPAAVFDDRAAAEAAAAKLAAAEVPAEVVPAGERYSHRLAHESWELLVPATQANRARALLNA